MSTKVFPPRPLARTHASSWVRSARRAAGLTQEQAAELLGVDARQVRRWESGESPMGALELVVLLEQRVGERMAA